MGSRQVPHRFHQQFDLLENVPTAILGTVLGEYFLRQEQFERLQSIVSNMIALNIGWHSTRVDIDRYLICIEDFVNKMRSLPSLDLGIGPEHLSSYERKCIGLGFLLVYSTMLMKNETEENFNFTEHNTINSNISTYTVQSQQSDLIIWIEQKRCKWTLFCVFCKKMDLIYQLLLISQLVFSSSSQFTFFAINKSSVITRRLLYFEWTATKHHARLNT